MAADLDQALEPGETIVYRARGRSYAGVATFFGSLLAGIFLFLLLSAVLHGSEVSGSRQFELSLWFYAVMAAFSLIALLILILGQRRDPDDVAITDRRLLFANSDWDSRMESMELAQIQRISWTRRRYPTGLEVVGSEGAIQLTMMRQADALARALAEAAGVAAPASLGRMSWAGGLHEVGEFLVAGAVAIALRHGFATAGIDPNALWAVAVELVAGIAAGLLLGPLVAIAPIRPFATAEQMRAGLCAERRSAWRVRPALAWVDLLYGRPPASVAAPPETGEADRR